MGRYHGGGEEYPGKVTNRRGHRVKVEYDDGTWEWTFPQLCRKPRE
jgi:hypothetical protein